MVLDALSFVSSMCLAKFNLGSKVRPNILGCLTVGISVLLMFRFSCVLYSAGSVVNSVAVDLIGFNSNLFSVVHS
jgi:hypothetical protein